MPVDLELARRWFAEDIREAAPVLRNVRIVEAFARVPREHYLGPGPWGVHSRLAIGDIHQSASDSPHHLYHDLQIAIDEASGINNGLPSLWARVYDHLDITPGATVLQVGAGVGYHTAILAELVSPQGHVIAYEIDADLAKRARHNLQHYANVDVIIGDATQAESIPELDSLPACAGVTRIPTRWLDSLKRNGQMVLPFTGADQWGFLMHVTKGEAGHPVKSIGPLGAYPCVGARSDSEALAITQALKSAEGGPINIGRYHVGHPSGDSGPSWVEGNDYWISKLPSTPCLSTDVVDRFTGQTTGFWTANASSLRAFLHPPPFFAPRQARADPAERPGTEAAWIPRTALP